MATKICGFSGKIRKSSVHMRKVQVNGGILAGERFDSVFWKNKVDGAQKFVLTWKLALKVEKPTIENRKNLEFSSR